MPIRPTDPGTSPVPGLAAAPHAGRPRVLAAHTGSRPGPPRRRARRRLPGALLTGLVLSALALPTGGSAAADPAPPGPPSDGPAPVEALPFEPAPVPDTSPCTADTGPYQRQLEHHLGLTEDGRQSEEDCRAIRAFQVLHQVKRRDGYADLETFRRTEVLEAAASPAGRAGCPTRSYRVTCVDLARQLLWVQRDGKLLYGPVPARTGRDGQETRTGWHRIERRVLDEHSELYNNAPMPYSQYFSGGQAIHGRYDDLYEGGGSAGCVNVRLADAKQLWNLIGIGDRVYAWGVKPGTEALVDQPAAPSV
ncbi:L,D-transpeptidase (plasmid) [Streptomyces sp. BI20]|uniref:L,D-transpeptidase n=1 Tax=Streptomyces sp. BI20 TaxID=3403460 RepID=UPI003C72ABDC